MARRDRRLKRARPAAMRLIDVSFKLKCTPCGVRGAQTITITVSGCRTAREAGALPI